MTELRMVSTPEESASSGDVYLPREGAAPSPIADWDPARGTVADAVASSASDDHGMEMFARVFVIGAATAIVLTALVLAWPVLERLMGGLS